MPPVRRDRALVIHLPAGRSHCELHWADITAGWDAARARRDLTTPARNPAGTA